jgi:hypothetical protein
MRLFFIFYLYCALYFSISILFWALNLLPSRYLPTIILFSYYSISVLNFLRYSSCCLIRKYLPFNSYFSFVMTETNSFALFCKESSWVTGCVNGDGRWTDLFLLRTDVSGGDYSDQRMPLPWWKIKGDLFLSLCRLTSVLIYLFLMISLWRSEDSLVYRANLSLLRSINMPLRSIEPYLWLSGESVCMGALLFPYYNCISCREAIIFTIINSQPD